MDSKAAVTNGHVVEDVLVTKKLANFVFDASYDTLNPAVVQKLKELLIDHIGVASNAACNAESSQPFMDAILAFGGSKGASTVYAKGKTFPTQYAALLNGAFAHTYDFDDTFAAGALHPGASVIPAALAQSESSNTDCKTLLIALAVGYEVVCRLARALGAGSYLRGFHSTGTAGIFGAIAAVGKVKNLSSDVIETAFGIAGSKAAGSMQFLENGSWNKRLHPGFAAHDALLCVSLAEAGVKGSSKVFEGSSGFLHSYTDKAELKGLIEGLGNEWIFMGTALKPYPACRMTHTSIELADKLSKEKAAAVESISVALSPTCWNIVGVPKTNKIRPENIVDAQFSIYVQIAIAWLYGSDIGWAAYQKIYDPDVRDLSARVRCTSDKDVVGLAAKLTVRWQDGTEREEFLDVPLGEASTPMSFHKIQTKFLSLTRSVYGEKSAVIILDIIKDLEWYSSADLVSLLK